MHLSCLPFEWKQQDYLHLTQTHSKVKKNVQSLCEKKPATDKQTKENIVSIGQNAKEETGAVQEARQGASEAKTKTADALSLDRSQHVEIGVKRAGCEKEREVVLEEKPKEEPFRAPTQTACAASFRCRRLTSWQTRQTLRSVDSATEVVGSRSGMEEDEEHCWSD